MTNDEALRQKQRAFAREQARISKELVDKCGAWLLEKYGAARYVAWQQATKEAGTR